MSSENTAKRSAGPRHVGLREQLAVYICGIFSSGTSNIIWVVVPLWAVSLDASPVMVGVALGAYTFLPLVFSIPGGALIDKLTPRKVIAVFGIIVVCAMPLYPLLPWMPALIVLQMIAGLSISMAWIATQTMVGQRMRGAPVYAGRLSFATRIGAMAGPPVVGLVWDLAGPWGAFPFIALWTSGMLLGIAILPRRRIRNPEFHPRLRAQDFAPQLSSYVEAFRMLAIPAILLVVVCSFLRQSGHGMQSSFYVVYLTDIGFSGTAIGTLLSAFLMAGAVTSLVVGWLTRYINPYWILMGTLFLSVLSVTVTPLLSVFFLLLAAIVMRGGSVGLMQPLMMSLVAQAAGRDRQGKGVGLRATANRTAMTVTPVVMGGVVEVVGLQNAFYIIGGTLIVVLSWVTWRFRGAAAMLRDADLEAAPDGDLEAAPDDDLEAAADGDRRTYAGADGSIR